MTFELFGYTFSIQRTPLPEPELSVVDRMIISADDLTNAWHEHINDGGRIRPWIDWPSKTVHLIKGFGKPDTIYPTED